jgi:hypothetical protein
MGAVGGMPFVRQELNLVAACRTCVAEEAAHDRGGYALTAMAVSDDDCLDERGRGAAVSQVRHRRHRRCSDCPVVDLGQVDREITRLHHPPPGLALEARDVAGTVAIRDVPGQNPQDRGQVPGAGYADGAGCGYLYHAIILPGMCAPRQLSFLSQMSGACFTGAGLRG